MAARIALDRLQRWMQAVIVDPGTVEEAVASKAAAAEWRADRIGEVILPSRTLTPVGRVGIYQGMYLLRMHDALADDYAGLRHFLGDDAFFRLVRAYVQVHPSRSYSLNRLGDHLPDFLKKVPRLRHRAFCRDLARLECAVAQVFDAEETPPLAPEAIAAVAEEDWPQSRLKPIAAFRLLELLYPANAYLNSLAGDDHDHPRPRRHDEWVVVYRQNFAVRRLPLSKAAHDLLHDLARGIPLGRAVSRAAASAGSGHPPQEALFGWFRDWVANGLFQAVLPGGGGSGSGTRAKSRKTVVRK